MSVIFESAKEYIRTVIIILSYLQGKGHALIDFCLSADEILKDEIKDVKNVEYKKLKYELNCIVNKLDKIDLNKILK